jgi:hypothetical protein
MRPLFESGRRRRPSSILAAVCQALIAFFTHTGIATVRTRPPLPTKSTMNGLKDLIWNMRRLEEKVCGAPPRLDDVEVFGLISLKSSLDNAGQHVCKLNASRL